MDTVCLHRKREVKEVFDKERRSMDVELSRLLGSVLPVVGEKNGDGGNRMLSGVDNESHLQFFRSSCRAGTCLRVKRDCDMRRSKNRLHGYCT